MPTPDTSADNPFASPQVKAGLPPLPPRLTFKRMLALLLVGIAGGAALGSITNTFNGAYFRPIMDWDDHIWLLAIRQGALEGGVYGAGYAILFIVIIAIASHRRCHFRTALRYVGLALIIVFAIWLLGGLTLTTAAWYAPELRNTWYCGYLGTWPAAGQYAWVGGSIYGGVRGGLVAVIVANAI